MKPKGGGRVAGVFFLSVPERTRERSGRDVLRYFRKTAKLPKLGDSHESSHRVYHAESSSPETPDLIFKRKISHPLIHETRF